MSDMAQAIIPKSDQLNADDLIAGEMTIKITGVDIKGGQEQPVSIHFEGDNGKPYKACKSMCRVMVATWGPDSKAYVGRSMTLFREPTVKWGGMEVGGIRISHMSDIESPMTMALTMTRANKKPFTVRPLVVAPRITVEEVMVLENRCREASINIDALKKAAKVSELSRIAPDDLPRAHAWIDAKIAKSKPAESVL